MISPSELLQAVMALSGRFQFRTTSSFRSRASNTAAGGVKFSAHQFWLAVDVVLETGQVKADFVESARRLGLLALDEGDHIHLQPADWAASSLPTAVMGRRMGAQQETCRL